MNLDSILHRQEYDSFISHTVQWKALTQRPNWRIFKRVKHD